MQQGVKSVLVRFKHPAQRTPPDFQKCPVASRPPYAPPSLQLRRPSRDARVLGWLARGPDCTERRPKDWHKQMQPGRTWGRAELTWKSLQAPGHTSRRLEERADERAEDGQRIEGRKAWSGFPLSLLYTVQCTRPIMHSQCGFPLHLQLQTPTPHPCPIRPPGVFRLGGGRSVGFLCSFLFEVKSSNTLFSKSSMHRTTSFPSHSQKSLLRVYPAPFVTTVGAILDLRSTSGIRALEE